MHEATPRAFLIEIPHAREECAAARAGVPCPGPARSYRGCGAGTHTTWIIAELDAEEDAWSLVPGLLRDTARVVPVEDCSLANAPEPDAVNARPRIDQPIERTGGS